MAFIFYRSLENLVKNSVFLAKKGKYEQTQGTNNG
jgi:hypothetical protein